MSNFHQQTFPPIKNENKFGAKTEEQCCVVNKRKWFSLLTWKIDDKIITKWNVNDIMVRELRYSLEYSISSRCRHRINFISRNDIDLAICYVYQLLVWSFFVVISSHSDSSSIVEILIQGKGLQYMRIWIIFLLFDFIYSTNNEKL